MHVPDPQRRAIQARRTASVAALKQSIFNRVMLAALVVVLWYLASRNVPAFVLPSPERVAATWIRLVSLPSFWEDLTVTLSRVLAGFALAAVVGSVLGLIMGFDRRIGDFLEPVVIVINTVSSVIWAIFALIWFGLSEGTTIFVVFMTSMPLILTNVWKGTQQVDPGLVELARTFRMSRSKILLKIYLPTIMPEFFSGARLAFGFGARVVLIAETLGSTSGIGYRLRQAADLVQTDQVFAWTITLVALMLTVEFAVLKPIEARLFVWRRLAAP
ncbi:hypothetical protein P775_15985 [Puniceibacterium antarcticum]|uniref:ABC transmembrane type-1 domain-containing protein n=2 Tax=Puniceibacterium antarcticum TaxID=1206336 RepID=A0A2G8RC68_9RHOB|nr:hypothetical protein P775_15985 [Puniceibacterium antarcticum]